MTNINIIKEYFRALFHASKTNKIKFSLLFGIGYLCWVAMLLLLIYFIVGFFINPIVLPIILGYITYFFVLFLLALNYYVQHLSDRTDA